MDDRQIGGWGVWGLQDSREPVAGHNMQGVGLLRPLYRGQVDRSAQNRFKPAHTAGKGFMYTYILVSHCFFNYET